VTHNRRAERFGLSVGLACPLHHGAVRCTSAQDREGIALHKLAKLFEELGDRDQVRLRTLPALQTRLQANESGPAGLSSDVSRSIGGALTGEGDAQAAQYYTLNLERRDLEEIGGQVRPCVGCVEQCCTHGHSRWVACAYSAKPAQAHAGLGLQETVDALLFLANYCKNYGRLAEAEAYCNRLLDMPSAQASVLSRTQRCRSTEMQMRSSHSLPSLAADPDLL
jgi:hypothetical protein